MHKNLIAVAFALLAWPALAQTPSQLSSGIFTTTGQTWARLTSTNGVVVTPLPSGAFAMSTGTFWDDFGRMLITTGQPASPGPGGYNCNKPMTIPSQPIGAVGGPLAQDSSLVVCGTYTVPNQVSNMVAATAYVNAAGADINAVLGTAAVSAGGGAGGAFVGLATAPGTVAHGVEVEADTWSPGTNTSGLFLIAGGDGVNPNGNHIRAISGAPGNSPINFINLDSTNGYSPVQAGGSILTTSGGLTRAAYGIDLVSVANMTYAWRSPGATIDGGGNIRVGGALGPMLVPSEQATVQGQASVVNWSTTPTLNIGNVTSAPSNNILIWYWYGSGWTPAGDIYTVGGVTSYGNISDYRSKTRVQPLGGGLAAVMALKPKTFEMKSAPGVQHYGFLAHEVAAVVPGAVNGAKDAVDASGKPVMQSMDSAKLIPLLVRAVQELEAEVRELKARKWGRQ